jgi:hypothetical protein
LWSVKSKGREAVLKSIFVSGAFVGLASCSSLAPPHMPTTSGEQESGYTYIPVDPFSVVVKTGQGCEGEPLSEHQLLYDLPDNAVRMLVERFDAHGNVTYGPVKAGSTGESYRVTVDFIDADTINIPVRIWKFMDTLDGKDSKIVDLTAPPGPQLRPGTERYNVARLDDNSTPEERQAAWNIPVYVGVGLRVSASVYTLADNVNVSGIGIIGAEADASRARGSLVVQTLGVNGKSISAALPIQSELNRTTAQNAIVAVGSIKALLWEEETAKSPRVVGLYLPFPGGKALVNALISELSRAPPTWTRQCLGPKQRAMGTAPASRQVK